MWAFITPEHTLVIPAPHSGEMDVKYALERIALIGWESRRFALTIYGNAQKGPLNHPQSQLTEREREREEV